VVIDPERIRDRVPVMTAAKGVPIIQWEKDQAEDAGLVKIDLLGNRSLAVIRDALRAVAASTGRVIDYDTWSPLDDPDTQALLARGETLGVFYVESPAMRQLQRKAGTGDFEHLVIHSSMIRPAANRYIREYLRRLKGGAYEPLHPALAESLAETHGIMCYQEDVTKAAMELAGFDAVDGDGLRKALSQKRPVKPLKAYRARFYEGARARGVEPKVIDEIWEMILSFAGYSFCKPHSASYALVSFKSAYLRAHYPAEFLAAVISNQGGYYATFAYVSEAKRMGLRVLPPDVNASARAWTGRGRTIRTGLMQLRGLRAEALEALLAERERGGPYRSLADLLARTGIDAGDARILVKAGCLDSIAAGRTRPGLLWELLLAERGAAGRGRGGIGRGRARTGPGSALEAGRGPRGEAAPDLFPRVERAVPRVPDYDEDTLLRHEVESLGFLLSRHPLALYERALRGIPVVRGVDLPKHAGERVTALGWWVTAKTVETREEEPMEFVSFEDTTSLYETVFFPRAYARFCHLLTTVHPFLLTGTVEEDYGAVTLSVEGVRRLDAIGVGSRGKRTGARRAGPFPAGRTDGEAGAARR
jgi:error-prone DNA polymerase